MRFLKLFVMSWREFFRRLLARFSLGKLTPDARLARYLVQSNRFNKDKGYVKPEAFLPNPTDLKTSVFRVKGLSDAQVCALGETMIATPLRKTLYGSGQLAVTEVEGVGLRVEPDDKPARHANISGWPPEKSERLSLAQQLAALATLRLCPAKGGPSPGTDPTPPGPWTAAGQNSPAEAS